MSPLCPKPGNVSHSTQRKTQSSHHGSQSMLYLSYSHNPHDPSLSLNPNPSLYTDSSLCPKHPPSHSSRWHTTHLHPSINTIFTIRSTWLILPTSHSLLYLFRIFSLSIFYLTYYIICWFAMSIVDYLCLTLTLARMEALWEPRTLLGFTDLYPESLEKRWAHTRCSILFE